MKLPWLKIITCFSLWTLADLVMSSSMKTKSLSRDPDRGVNYANFMKHLHSYLDVKKVGVLLVQKLEECAISCVTYDNCFSFNVATQTFDAGGHYLCELLGSDKYGAATQLKANSSFHHFSIATPCSKKPCKSGGTCVAKYEEDNYTCLCHPLFEGRLCENSKEELPKSVILARNATYLQQLEAWLLPVKSALSFWRRCWHGNTDGFSLTNFHSRCDLKGPTVTIVRVDSYVFGGYTDRSWHNNDGCIYRGSYRSFLFTLNNTNGIPEKLGLRLGYSGHAILTCSSLYPTFGTDLYIKNKCNTETGSFTNSGKTYQAPKGCPGGGSPCSVLAGSYSSWIVSDIEVFYEQKMSS